MGLGHRLRDQSVVSSVHCMNDPQAEGHMASHIGRRKFLATLGVARAGGNTCGPQSVHVGSLVGNRTLSRHRRMTESDPNRPSEVFARLAYRPWSQTARWKRGIIPLLHE